MYLYIFIYHYYNDIIIFKNIISKIKNIFQEVFLENVYKFKIIYYFVIMYF